MSISHERTEPERPTRPNGKGESRPGIEAESVELSGAHVQGVGIDPGRDVDGAGARERHLETEARAEINFSIVIKPG